MRRTHPGSAAALIATALLAGPALPGCGRRETRAPAPAPPPSATAPVAPAAPPAPPAPVSEWVGANTCASCHAEEAAHWRGSHHARAMRRASERSVLGDFGGARLEHFGTVSTFRRDGDGFLVRTDGADGLRHSYPIAYTFGADPLQQYLVAFPRGRYQVLDLAWDSRPAEAGGQRWFHLHPDEPIPPDDVLHWTRPSHTWNAMCADCHATNLQKGYVAAEDRYATTWSEVGVACEACHGPGARHVAWAREGARSALPAKGFDVDLVSDASGEWVLDPGAPIAHRQPPRRADAVLETCAPCHSRRSPIASGWRPGRPLLDAWRPVLLEEGLYHADGQILDEVYVYGSFLQSRMYAAGVTCTDCHDAHEPTLRGDPSEVCGRCHRSEVFATPAHHHHEPGSAGSRCVSCHMPQRTYMRVDPRQDHSFRVPRPDETAAIGVPNACNDCHGDRTARWAADAVAQWRGAGSAPPAPHWGEAIHAGRRRLPGAAAALAALATDATRPGIARATALSLLAQQPDPQTLPAIQAGLGDPDPLVRLGALDATEPLPPSLQIRLAPPLLRDPRRAVRIEAARVLASLPAPLRASLGDAFTASLAEYEASQELNADRPEARVNLGVLYARLGQLERARQEMEVALGIEPSFVPAYVDLADLLRVEGDDAEGERVLRRGLERVPGSAPLEHALGLALVRLDRRDEALECLGHAAEAEPENARYAFVYGVALRDAGQPQRAREVLERALARHPGDAELRAALDSLGSPAAAPPPSAR